jgi:hypothetical protein
VSRRIGEYVGQCGACKKRTYPNRRTAQATAKTIPGRHMNAYRCPDGTGWHLGHLPIDVIHGETAKADYVQRITRGRHSRSAS